MSKTQESAQLINKAAIEVDSMASLIAVEVWDGRKVDLSGFYADTPFGFKRQFTYDASQAKTGHDGWSIINPDHLSTIGSANWYSSTGDSTDDSGSGCWVRDVEGWVNVLEAGAKPSDDTHDSTTAFEAIRDKGNTLLVDDYFYVNMDLGGVNIIGMDRDTAKLESFVADGYALTLTNNAVWRRQQIQNLYLIGDGVAATKSGIQFGDATYTSGDEFIGRYAIRYCTFDELDYCIRKRYGNIGNIIEDCSFETSNYHYYAEKDESGGTYTMHGGSDLLIGNHLKAAELASIYIDSPEGDGGQFTFIHNVIESNPGFGIFVKNYERSSSGTPIRFIQTWPEANATSGSVTINGTGYTPKDVYFEDCDLAVFDEIKLGSFQLVKSICRVGSAGSLASQVDISVDSDSSFIVEKWEGNTVNDVNLYIQQFLPNQANNTFASIPHLKKTTKSYSDSLVISRVFNDDDSWTFPGGSTSRTATRENDGVLFDSCAEFETVDGSVNLLHSSVTIPAGYVVFTISVKKISGIDGGIDLTGGTTIINNIPVTGSGWKTLVGFDKIDTDATSMSLRSDSKSGGTTVMRIGELQIHSFSTLEEAHRFLSSGLFQLPSDYNSVVYGDSVPTNGVWIQGDIIYNTSAAASGNIGWVCVTGGSPGTWKTFGDISA